MEKTRIEYLNEKENLVEFINKLKSAGIEELTSPVFRSLVWVMKFEDLLSDVEYAYLNAEYSTYVNDVTAAMNNDSHVLFTINNLLKYDPDDTEYEICLDAISNKVNYFHFQLRRMKDICQELMLPEAEDVVEDSVATEDVVEVIDVTTILNVLPGTTAVKFIFNTYDNYGALGLIMTGCDIDRFSSVTEFHEKGGFTALSQSVDDYFLDNLHIDVSLTCCVTMTREVGDLV